MRVARPQKATHDPGQAVPLRSNSLASATTSARPPLTEHRPPSVAILTLPLKFGRCRQPAPQATSNHDSRLTSPPPNEYPPPSTLAAPSTPPPRTSTSSRRPPPRFFSPPAHRQHPPHHPQRAVDNSSPLGAPPPRQQHTAAASPSYGLAHTLPPLSTHLLTCRESPSRWAVCRGRHNLSSQVPDIVCNI